MSICLESERFYELHIKILDYIRLQIFFDGQCSPKAGMLKKKNEKKCDLYVALGPWAWHAVHSVCGAVQRAGE